MSLPYFSNKQVAIFYLLSNNEITKKFPSDIIFNITLLFLIFIVRIICASAN